MLPNDLLTADLQLAETHISWVFLGVRDVWKVKKPVSLGFLDFSTPDLRRQACEAEVRLNGRLAPDVYKGVVPITLDEDRRHRLGGDGEPVDWAVHIRRLPDTNRADVRLSDGRLTGKELDAIARRISAFHAAARCGEDVARFGSVEAIGVNVKENFDQTRRSVQTYVSKAQADEIEAWQTEFLEDRRDVFERRIVEGRIRDGHGDLRLDHVYLTGTGEVIIIDCIEFNERFRYIDVCADVAFLSMDLSMRGHVDLAERFLARYARAANDYDLFPLVDFYESYRAYVRGKVSSILARDEGAHASTRARAAEEARRYYLLALASERRSLLPPVVVAVGGIVGTGKSTVAERIAEELGAPVVDADRTRKYLLGVDATTPVPDNAWQGAYAPECTEKVYSEVLRRAGAVLASGRAVVLDASFRSRAHRGAAKRLARERNVPFYFVECHASAGLCRERLAARASQTGVSDGRPAIFDEFVARWEAVDDGELGNAEHIRIETSKSLDENLEMLRKRIGTWPPGLTQ